MLGEKIKEIRIKKGMTQKELAEKLFMTAQAVSRWENNEVEPSVSTLAKMAKIFEISVDEILEIENTREEIVSEPQVQIVEREVPAKPVLGVCTICNKPIYNGQEIIRVNSEVHCKSCEEKRIQGHQNYRKSTGIRKRRKSFIVSSIIAAIFLIFAISFLFDKDFEMFGVMSVVAILSFTYTSCWLLKNNFIEDMTEEIISWSFVRMPGVIFSLDLDGIIWLITVKVALWLLGIFIGLFFCVFAISLGLFLSIFVYPFALRKNIKHPELYEEF